MTPVHFSSISKIQAELMSGALTAVSLTRLLLERIEACNGRLNAFVTVTAAAAPASRETMPLDSMTAPRSEVVPASVRPGPGPSQGPRTAPIRVRGRGDPAGSGGRAGARSPLPGDEG